MQGYIHVKSLISQVEQLNFRAAQRTTFDLFFYHTAFSNKVKRGVKDPQVFQEGYVFK